MIRILLCILILNAPTGSAAQNLATYQRSYHNTKNEGYWVHKVLLSADQNYYITGPVDHGASNSIIKTNPDGDTIWTRLVRTQPGMVGSIGSSSTYNNGCIVISYYDPTVLGGYLNSQLLAVDDQGTVMWCKKYELNLLHEAPGHLSLLDLVPTNDSGSLIIGSARGYPVAVKIDRNGDIVWANEYHLPLDPYSLAKTLDSNFIICGSSRGGDLFLMKIGQQGNILWQKDYSADSTGLILDVLTNMPGLNFNPTSDSGYIITCHSQRLHKDIHTTVIKTDRNGDIEWSKILHPGYTLYGPNDVVEGKPNEYIISGTMHSGGISANDNFLIKIDAVGDVIWSNTYGGNQNDIAGSLIYHNNHIVTTAEIRLGYKNYSLQLIKTDDAGTLCNGNVLAVQSDTIEVYATSNNIITNGLNVIATDEPYVIKNTAVNTGIICSTLSSGDITGKSSMGVSIYPNPSEGSFHIQFDQLQPSGVITVYNVVGQTIYGCVIENEQSKLIELGNLPPGLYILNILSGSSYYTEKIFIE